MAAERKMNGVFRLRVRRQNPPDSHRECTAVDGAAGHRGPASLRGAAAAVAALAAVDGDAVAVGSERAVAASAAPHVVAAVQCIHSLRETTRTMHIDRKRDKQESDGSRSIPMMNNIEISIALNLHSLHSTETARNRP